MGKLQRHIRLPNEYEIESLNLPIIIKENVLQQIELCIECQNKIDNEGVVVRNTDGTVIAHPAINVQANSVKLLSDLIKKHG
jgi:hypothetical protein